MNEKITTQHKQKTAIIYVRQSTGTQVRHNLESKRRQYGLKEHAVNLGFCAAEVIDDDLGRSGSGLVERPGFARLLERVCSGQIGAVLALEASRLARNNRDWHHLIDLCAMTGTLVLDYDGVYDPRLLNDRLLLGLKGTMSEFELGLLRQRAQEALRQKIRRGEVLFTPPVGYVRTENNAMEMIADLQVQAAVRGLFARFESCGSARQTLLWYRQREMQLPTIDSKGRVVWSLPVFGRIIGYLKNPCYAGSYVYGRTTTRLAIADGRQRRTAGHAVDVRDWSVLIHDHHRGYITWERFQANQKILKENAAMSGKMRTAVKRGTALLSGLVRCGHCGRPMRTYYSGSSGTVARYFCSAAMIQEGAGKCIGLGATRVDEAVGRAVVSALQPLGIEASITAIHLADEDRNQRKQGLLLAAERARYEADRCRRQFEAVEPENRLVAAELERRWNASLAESAKVEDQVRAVGETDQGVREGERALLDQLATDVGIAWQHGAVELKKRILRTVLTEVIIRLEEDGSQPIARLTFHWAGGTHTAVRIPKNRSGQHGRTTDQKSVAVIKMLATTTDDAQIAGVLNRGGHRTGSGVTWTAARVAHVRRKENIAPPKVGARGTWLTRQQAAKALGLAPATLDKLLKNGILQAHQPIKHAGWFIAPSAIKTDEVRAAIAKIRSGKTRRDRGVNTMKLAFDEHGN